jgi:hypothetical protein
MVGFLIFDGWIGNTDRHHANWGVIRSDGTENDRIAPTFDHASSLGRLLEDDKRTRILEGRDRLDVRDYLDRSKAAGAIFPLDGNSQVPPFKLVCDLCSLGFRNAVDYWIAQIDSVAQSEVENVFDRFPSTWMSTPARDFALRILDITVDLMKQEAASCDT